MAQWIKAGPLASLPPGTVKLVPGSRFPVSVFNIGGNLFAIDDRCPHRAGPLSEGKLEGTVVTCPWHRASFNLESGAVVCGVAQRGLRKFPVRCVGDEIEVEVPDEPK